MDIIQFISDIDAFVWGPPMIVLLLGSHLFLKMCIRDSSTSPPKHCSS